MKRICFALLLAFFLTAVVIMSDGCHPVRPGKYYELAVPGPGIRMYVDSVRNGRAFGLICFANTSRYRQIRVKYLRKGGG